VYDFEEIDPAMDEALVCNSFHRFILTQSMADILSFAITCQQYVLAVEVFQTFGAAKPQKVFQGVLDPSIMAYPGGEYTIYTIWRIPFYIILSFILSSAEHEIRCPAGLPRKT